MKKKFGLVLMMLALFLAAAACGFSFTTANLGSAQMARDPGGNQPTTTFSPGDTFYAVVDLDNAPDDTVVRAVWTAVDVEGTEPNTQIDTAEITTGSNQLHFTLENDSPWPPGEYQVELYLGDELEETLSFEVGE